MHFVQHVFFFVLLNSARSSVCALFSFVGVLHCSLGALVARVRALLSL